MLQKKTKTSGVTKAAGFIKKAGEERRGLASGRRRCDGRCGGQTRVLTWGEALSKGRLMAGRRGGRRRTGGREKESFRAVAVALMPRTMKTEGPEEGISRKAAFTAAPLANRYRI